MLKYIIPVIVFLNYSNSNIEEMHPHWDKPIVEGHWKLVNSTLVKNIPFANIYKNPHLLEPAMEISPFEYYRESDVIFKDDRFYKINYPLEIVEETAYTIDTGYLHKDGFATSPIEFKNDTLSIYVKGIYGTNYLKEDYIPTAFNDSILNEILTHKINYPELAGTWFLVREEDYDYGSYYELDFPHTIPDSIIISREDFIEIQQNDYIFNMITDNEEKPYQLHYYRHTLHLKPMDWYQDPNPSIHFDKSR